jgi:integrase
VRRGDWKGKLKAIVREHNRFKVDKPGTVSHRTRDKREADLFAMIATLREIGHKIKDPANLRPKHIEALVEHWMESGKAVSTINNHLSVLRVFCTWLGKERIVKSLADYFPGLSRQYAATYDKSWSANDADFWEIWDRVFDEDLYVAMQLLLICAFGARAKESIMFQPRHQVIADGKVLALHRGTKGGRPRVVPIDDAFKREVVQLLREFAQSRWMGGDGHLGNPDRTLQQNITRYYTVLHNCGVSKEDIGVTGHGLRSEYACDELERRGIMPTIRGGSGKTDSPLATEIAYLHVSESLGHGRKSVMPAYAGGFLNVPAQPLPANTDVQSKVDRQLAALAPRATRIRLMLERQATKAWKGR